MNLILARNLGVASSDFQVMLLYPVTLNFSFKVAQIQKYLFFVIRISITCLFSFVYPTVVFLLLFLNWVVLSGKLDAFHLSLGVVSCLIVTVLSQDLLYHDRAKGLRIRLLEAWAFVRYVPWIIWEVVKANAHVLKLAMTKKGYEEMSPRVVTFETYLKTDFAKFVLANSITLTPGTITMLIRDDVFHIHTMSQFLEDDLLTGSIERKVAEVFEPEGLKKS